jgi:hypothetical protein
MLHPFGCDFTIWRTSPAQKGLLLTTETRNQIPDVEYETFDINALVGKDIGPITVFPPIPANSVSKSWDQKPPRDWEARLSQCYNACEDTLDTAQTHARTRENPRTQIAHYFLDGLEPPEIDEIEDWMRRINVLMRVMHHTGLVRGPSRPIRR